MFDKYLLNIIIFSNNMWIYAKKYYNRDKFLIQTTIVLVSPRYGKQRPVFLNSEVVLKVQLHHREARWGFRECEKYQPRQTAGHMCEYGEREDGGHACDLN